MIGEDVQLVRAVVVLAIESTDGLALLGPGDRVTKLAGSSGDLASAVLAFCVDRPRSRAAILEHIETLSGEPLGDPTVVDQLLELLQGLGALREAKPVHPPETAPPAGPRVLVGVSGAVAAMHAPSLVQHLQARGFDVRVAATENALRFVSREAVEALTHRAVFSSMWQRDEGVQVPHIELAEWADLVVVWPATAATLSRIATGDCAELLSATVIATRAPVLLAPAMNDGMYTSPAVQRNLATLRDDGFHLVLPALAQEVALAPRDRVFMVGGAPGPEAMARLVQAMLLLGGNHRALPVDAAGWEALHRRTPERSQAWFIEEVDAPIARAVTAHASTPARLLDVGTGHGACALWAARQGFEVVATDVSRTALDRARRRAGALPITFLEDDITRSALSLRFDVVVDRGTLHCLPPARREAYARQLRRCLRAGGVAILEVHAPPADGRVASHPMTTEDLDALLGPEMQRVAAEPGTFAGTVDPPPRAVTYVFRHTPAAADAGPG